MTRKHPTIVLNGRSYKEMKSIYLEHNLSQGVNAGPICGENYAYQPCIAEGCKTERDSLN
ncbi:hypothetical protein RDI58_005865 [Solanum bulbocastanum]|uniref:Uncharacterized protein n=1 Tax=Solanum bulbocastanum TaxID=147425 RepID=A0AAN8YRC0_SOLBU